MSVDEKSPSKLARVRAVSRRVPERSSPKKSSKFPPRRALMKTSPSRRIKSPRRVRFIGAKMRTPTATVFRQRRRLVFCVFRERVFTRIGKLSAARFRDKVVGSGFASRIKSPPKIASKAKWNPLHLVGLSTLRSVAQTGRWPIEEKCDGLSHLIVEKTWAMGALRSARSSQHDGSTVAADVLARCTKRSALSRHPRAGRSIWAIMSNPVIDKRLRKLILTAEAPGAFLR